MEWNTQLCGSVQQADGCYDYSIHNSDLYLAAASTYSIHKGTIHILTPGLWNRVQDQAAV